MTIMHHADDATLMSYAAGSLPEALNAVVASHIAMCPLCREQYATMNQLGAVLLSSLPASPMTTPPPRTPTRINMPILDGNRVLPAGLGDVPAPLTRIVGSELSAIQWKRLGLGVWHKPLALSDGAKGDLRLIKVAPGQAMPEHGHGGSELSLILAGSYTDHVGRFGVGDLADLDEDIEHQPLADPQTGCICLIASTERARFKGLIARIVQPFVGI